MALGILLLSLSGGGSSEAVHFLFGDILLVSQRDLLLLSSVSVAIAIYTFLYWREIVLMAVHADLATVEGVAVTRHTYVLMALCGLAVTCLLMLMGVILAIQIGIFWPLNGFSA